MGSKSYRHVFIMQVLFLLMHTSLSWHRLFILLIACKCIRLMYFSSLDCCIEKSFELRSSCFFQHCRIVCSVASCDLAGWFWSALLTCQNVSFGWLVNEAMQFIIELFHYVVVLAWHWCICLDGWWLCRKGLSWRKKERRIRSGSALFQ